MACAYSRKRLRAVATSSGLFAWLRTISGSVMTDLSSAPGPQHPHACWQARVRLLQAADVRPGKPALAHVVKQTPAETMEAQDAPGQRVAMVFGLTDMFYRAVLAHSCDLVASCFAVVKRYRQHQHAARLEH